MATLSTIALILAAALTAQDPFDIPGGWGDEPPKAIAIEDPAAEAAEENRLLAAVAAAERRGPDHPLLAGPLEDLGGFYLVRKRQAQAGPLFRRALEIREKMQGLVHPDVAATLCRLAICRFLAKEKDDTAAPMLRRALAIYEKRGKDSAEVAGVLRLLGLDRMRHGDLDAAETDLSRALAIREKIAKDSEDVARLFNDLGTLNMLRVASSQAPDPEAILAGKPPSERSSERAAGRAEDYLKRSLSIREKLLDRDDNDIAGTLFDLAQLAMIRERPGEAEPFLERWLKLREAAKAPPSEKHVKVHFMLAASSIARKDFDAAERRLAKTQDLAAKVHGPESDEVVTILLERDDAALQAGRFDDAEAFLRQALGIETAIIGADDPDIVQVREWMARGYRDHAGDRKAPLLWHRMHDFSREVMRRHRGQSLDDVIDEYLSLLQRTNRVVPRPTPEDVAYLKKIDAVGSWADAESVMNRDYFFAARLDDEGLSHIGRMYLLESLDLDGRREHVTDAGLAHLANLVGLETLSLIDTDITDAALAHLAGLENLETLFLLSTRVTDAGLVHLKGLKKLRYLHLGFTDVTDAGLDNLRPIGSLRKLDLTHTRVTPEAVNRLRRARPELEIEYSRGDGFFRAEPLNLGSEPPDDLVPTAPARP